MPSGAPELIPPVYEWMPEYDKTFGPEVAEVAELAGFVPDPEQRLALDRMFALGVNGKAAVRDFGICAPRQNLKTGLLKMAALGWLFITEQRLVVWSAHEFSTAQEAFRDMTQLIEGCPALEREIKQIHRGNGDEQIELTGDRRLKFKARTKTGGRGLSGDKVVLDEAMYLMPAHVGSLVPTLRARPDPQVILAGSAGMLESGVWRGYRDTGRAGGDPTSAWLEWSDPNAWDCPDGCSHVFGVEGCSLDDRARWWRLNTALGRRITEQTLASDRRSLPWAEFARETGGWWEDPPTGGGIIDLQQWAGLSIGNDVEMVGPQFALELALDRSRSTIGAAWLVGDRPHLEVVDDEAGTSWVVDRCKDLTDRYGGVVALDAYTEAAELVPELEAAGVPVRLLKSADRAAACGGFFDAASSGGVSHNGDPLLAQALGNARWSTGADRRTFERRRSAGSIAALYACTFALYALATQTGPSVYEDREFLVF